MTEQVKIVWLKRVLMWKVILTVLIWGLPPWIGPVSLLERLGRVPDPPFYMRISGGTSMGLAFLFWLAFKDPVRNRDTIRYGVVDNVFAFVTIIGYALTVGVTNPVVWLSAVLVLAFAIAFYVLIPNPTTELAFGPVKTG